MRYESPKAIVKDKRTITGTNPESKVEIEFHKFLDPDNLYICSMCDKPILGDEFWLSQDTVGAVMCCDDCRNVYEGKIKENLDALDGFEQEQADAMGDELNGDEPKEVELEVDAYGNVVLATGNEPGIVIGVDSNGQPIRGKIKQ